ncbi:TetR/AcrR family transcriptional regulator [Camelimonas abortus]|uniref:TetR/AcrR family transcriptional regulator n=1 Tax=Camelimonas abortus TaxID=1017184 RepID=A0ABV7LEQ6_9HYPH
MTEAHPLKASGDATATSARKGRGARRTRADGRLSRKDWIEAGQEILRKEGISAVKLAALTRRLGVSTGSFYHHFSDFEDYLGALAAAFSMDSVRGVLERTAFDDPDPLNRVRELARLSVAEGTFELDRAMRIWATMDQRAAATVREAEAQVLAFLSEAFRDLGFDETEAELRSRILMSVNIAQLQLFEGGGRRRFFKQAMELLARPDGATTCRKSA